MELEHQADSVTIVEENDEEEKEGKGEEKVEWQKSTELKSFWCQRLSLTLCSPIHTLNGSCNVH